MHCTLCNRPKSWFEQIRPHSLLDSPASVKLLRMLLGIQGQWNIFREHGEKKGEHLGGHWSSLKRPPDLFWEQWWTHGPLERSLHHLHIILEQLHLNYLKEPWNSSKNVGNLTRTLRDSSEHSHILLSLSPEVINIAHSLLNRLKYICMAMRVGTTTHKNRETDRWRKTPFTSHLVFNVGLKGLEGSETSKYLYNIHHSGPHWSHDYRKNLSKQRGPSQENIELHSIDHDS